METMISQEAAFSNMAAAKFDDILNQIRGSSLNFQMKVSPFTAVIYLSKSITKDKFGNYLQQNVSVNRKNKDLDDLVSKNLELEEEIATLRRSYLETSESLAKIERKLDELSRHRENENYCKMTSDISSIPTCTSTPLTTKSKECISKNSVCDSGVDLRISVPTMEEAKDHDPSIEFSCTVCPRIFATEEEINHPWCKYDEEYEYGSPSYRTCCKKEEGDETHYSCIEKVLSFKRISCDLCKEVFKNGGELITHKKQQHDPSLEYFCEFCSRTFATEEEMEPDQHHEEFKYGCFSCKICFISKSNYDLHVIKSHQKVSHISKSFRMKTDARYL